MAKICKVCNQSYADDLAACPHCSSNVEIVLNDPSGPAKKGVSPTAATSLRPETGSDSDIEIDLGKLPQPAAGEPSSAISNVQWSALVSGPGDSGVDLAGGGMTVDSPSDAALLERMKPKTSPPSDQGEKSGSWVEVHLGGPVEDGSGVVVEAGSGSDEDIDLARLEAESRGKGMGSSDVVVEGTGAKRPPAETASGSDIDLGALAAASEKGSGSGSNSPFPEHLLVDDGSEVNLGQERQKSDSGPSGLDLVAEALESGVDLAARDPATGDSGVDLADLFDEKSPVTKKQSKPVPSPSDASAVDLGQLAQPADPAARAGRTPTSSEVQFGAAPQLAGGSDILGGSDRGEGGLRLADDGDDRGRGPIVPSEHAPSRSGAWVGGGIMGALAGAGAFASVWLAGLLPGGQDAGKTSPASGNGAEVRQLQAANAQLRETSESEAKTRKALEAELKDAGTKADVAIKEVLKEAQAKEEATRKQETALKTALEEAKKAADPKALERLKKERAADAAKIAQLEKDRKATDAKNAELEKAKKAADLKAADQEKERQAAERKVADLDKERKAAEQKVADLTLALKQAKGGGGDAMQKLLESARVEAADAKKRLGEAAQKLDAVEKSAQAARDQAALAKKEADDARKTAGAAQATVKTLEQKLKDTDARIQAADARAKEATDKLRTAAAQADAATEARAKTDAALQAVTKQLADAKASIKQLMAQGSGTSRSEFPAEAVDPLEAEEQYAAGVRAFHRGDYAGAEGALFEAARHGGQDARYLYFLGLSRWAQGKGDVAAADFREAARLERQRKPGRAAVSAALERVQGAARQAVERFR